MRRRWIWISAAGGVVLVGALCAFVGLAALGHAVLQTAQARGGEGVERPLERDAVSVFGTVVHTRHDMGFGETSSGNAFILEDSVADIHKYSSRIGDQPGDRAALASVAGAVSGGVVADAPWFTIVLSEWGQDGPAAQSGDRGVLDESNVRGIMMLWRTGDCCEVGLWIPGERPEDLTTWERVEGLSGTIKCALRTDEVDAYHAYVVPPGPDVEMRQIWLFGDPHDSAGSCDRTRRIKDLVRAAPDTEYAERWLGPEPTWFERAQRTASYAGAALRNPGAALRVVLK